MASRACSSIWPIVRVAGRSFESEDKSPFVASWGGSAASKARTKPAATATLMSASLKLFQASGSMPVLSPSFAMSISIRVSIESQRLFNGVSFG